MRDTILGVLLGLLITLVFALVEYYKVAVNILWAFLGVAVLLFILTGLWRVILKEIYKRNFDLWMRINEINAPPNPDEFNEKYAVWKAKKEAKKLERDKERKQS